MNVPYGNEREHMEKKWSIVDRRANKSYPLPYIVIQTQDGDVLLLNPKSFTYNISKMELYINDPED